MSERKGPNKRAGETGPNTGRTLGTPFTRERKEAYCKALIQHRGQKLYAAREIGVSGTTVDNHLRDDPEFRAMFEETMAFYRESLQSEAHRRAVEGTLKPVYFQGRRAVDTDEDGNEVPAAIREYDTALLVLLLKRHCPEFREKSVVENRNVNVDMGLKDMESMTREQREKLRELLKTEGDPGEQEAEPE